MNKTPLLAVAMLAATLTPGITHATDKKDDGIASHMRKTDPAKHSHTQEKMGIPQGASQKMPAEPNKESEPDKARNKHLHPRDGK